MKKRWTLLVLLASWAGFHTSTHALGTEEFGPDRSNRPTVEQPEWPDGIGHLRRHPSRVYSKWVNGDEQFYFKADPDQVNELISLFSQARLRDHEIKVEPGIGKARSFDSLEVEHNVSLQVVAGIARWHAEDQLYKGAAPTLPLEPRLTIYSGGDAAWLTKLPWPTNAIIDCRVPGVSIPSPRVRASRASYYGRLELADGSPPQAFARNFTTRITLWEPGCEAGFGLAHANNHGRFVVLLSREELATLEAGKTWLTVTLGNWQVKPASSDPRFPVDRLSTSADKAQPFQVGTPPTYYGRLVFEDGAPAVLKPGAMIMVEFPYAGLCEPDAEGYFKVVLTPDQLNSLRADKPSKNVCIPGANGRSAALFEFSPSLLADTKEKAGILKIPRPQ